MGTTNKQAASKQPTVKQLLARRHGIKKREDKLKQDKKKLKEDCLHPVDMLDIRYKADRGNYDPSSDTYWVEVMCHVCTKRWEFDSKEERGSYNNPEIVCKEME